MHAVPESEVFFDVGAMHVEGVRVNENIWVAIGGRGSLYGAALGAVLVNYAKTYFTGALPEIWLFMLGALFVAVTLFMPKGIVGSISAFNGVKSIWKRKGGRTVTETADG